MIRIFSRAGRPLRRRGGSSPPDLPCGAERLEEELLLGPEVVVETALGRVGGLDDVRGGRAHVALHGEELQRLLDDAPFERYGFFHKQTDRSVLYLITPAPVQGRFDVRARRRGGTCPIIPRTPRSPHRGPRGPRQRRCGARRGSSRPGPGQRRRPAARGRRRSGPGGTRPSWPGCRG